MSSISVHNRLTWLFESPVGDATRGLLGNIFGALIKRVGFAADSPLEEDGFELPVPLATERLSCQPDALAGCGKMPCTEGILESRDN